VSKVAVHFFEVEYTTGIKGFAAFGPSDLPNPQPNPQNAMSYTTSANFGSPRGSVKSLKSLIWTDSHGGSHRFESYSAHH
jgi:hypothetical protein